ncbi:MAG: XdhC family protein [Thermoplasmataceae archaeon]
METTGFAEEIHRLISHNMKFVTATVVRTEGSSLAKPGFKVVIHNGEIIYGTLGGACPDSVILDAAEQVLSTGTPRTIRIHLEESGKGLEAIVSRKLPDEIFVETFCGGTIDVFLEAYRPRDRLIIIGQGGKDDIEDSLVGLGKLCDFQVTVVDHAPSLTNKPDVLISDLDYNLQDLKVSRGDYVVILTKGDRDVPTLRNLASAEASYTGLMASRKRVKRDFEELLKAGVSEDFLTKVHTPIGLDIGAISPQEIAVSIMAEVIRVRRNGPPAEQSAEKMPEKRAKPI